MALEVRLEGWEEVRKKLRKLPGKLAKKTIKVAQLRAAAALAQEVIARAPVGPTGRLSDSIKHGLRRAKPGEVATKVTANIFYARMVEYGTSKMSARPFMRPAFDAKKAEMIEIISKSLKADLEKEVNSGG